LVFDRLASFSDIHEDLGSGAINSPSGERKIGIVDNRQGARQVIPSLLPIAGGFVLKASGEQ
jgi:hypothetical protein